jgi:hypothetical protein
MKNPIVGMVAAALLLMSQVAPAHAQVALRFTPADATVAPGSTGQLSLMLDDALDVRTIDIRVSFDPAVVRSLGGSDGSLYTASGFQLFQGFEDSAPGEWYGYTVIIGSGDYIVGPGELYVWEFEALAEGVSPVTDVQTYMSAPGNVWYPEVAIGPTTIIVGDPLSAVADLPLVPTDLRIWPNPFNPRTHVGFDLQADTLARLAVYDPAGRRVAILYEGPAAAGQLAFEWDGRDDRGRMQPGGVYLFQLTTGLGTTGARGVLLK